MGMRIFWTAICSMLLWGCGSVEKTETRRYVRVDWWGHTCFQITSSLGVKVLTNPFQPGAAPFRQPPDMRPDLLLVSKERNDFNHVDLPENAPRILRGAATLGANNVAGLTVTAVATGANTEPGSGPRMNVSYVWNMDGMRFCFLGAPDRPPDQEQISEIGRVDVLFLPIGVSGSLSDAQATAVVEALYPRVVIPMGPSWERIQQWAQQFGQVHALQVNAFIISRDTLPTGPSVVICAKP